MSIKKIIFAATLIFTSAASASDWAYIATSSDGNDIYIDKNSMSYYIRLFPKVWALKNYPKPQDDELDGHKYQYQSVLEVNYFDCDQRRIAVSDNERRYTEINAGGYNVFSIEGGSGKITNADFNDVVPDSIGEAKLNYVCSNLPRK